eukprot:1847020-Rhodomonas_salina.4
MGWYALLRVGGVCIITDLKLSKLDKGKATESVCWRATKHGDAIGPTHTVVLPVDYGEELSQSVHMSTQGRRISRIQMVLGSEIGCDDAPL